MPSNREYEFVYIVAPTATDEDVEALQTQVSSSCCVPIRGIPNRAGDPQCFCENPGSELLRIAKIVMFFMQFVFFME